MVWFAHGDKRRTLITDAPTLEAAIERAARVVSLPILGYQAAAIAEAAGIWASGAAAVLQAVPRHAWEDDRGREHLRQRMRSRLLDKITREGHVPVSLPAERLYRTPFMPWMNSADDAPVPQYSMPADSDWEQVVIVLGVGVRTPPVDRQAAVRLGILGGSKPA